MFLYRGASVFLLTLIFSFMLAAPSRGKDVKTKQDEWEENVGKAASVEIEEEFGVVNDREATQKCSRMVQRLVSFAAKKPPLFSFQCKILNATDINAFSLPGGYIYVTKGLLSFVQSDHELAAVLAHEIGHSFLRHAFKKIQKDKKVFVKTNLGALLAAILTQEPSSIGPLYIAANAIRTDALSGYGRKAELEADAQSVKTLYAAGYNPVGVLTMLERLMRQKNRHPQVEMGIFQTHPDPEMRVKEALAFLKQLGIPVNRRLVTQGIKAQVKTEEGAVVLYLNDTPLVKFYGDENGKNPLARAEECADALEQALNNGLESGQVRAVVMEHTGYVMAGKITLLSVTEEDARGAGKSLEEMTNEAQLNIRKELWQDLLNTTTF